MTSPDRETAISFHCEEPFKGFARISGTASLTGAGIHFQYGMTQTGTAPPRPSVTRLLPYQDISNIELRNHWISTVKIRFRVRSATTIECYPTTDPTAFEIEVSPTMKSGAEAFVKEANSRCVDLSEGTDSAV